MFEEDSLFTPMESSRSTEVSGSQFFINFLNQLEVPFASLVLMV